MAKTIKQTTVFARENHTNHKKLEKLVRRLKMVKTIKTSQKENSWQQQ